MGTQWFYKPTNSPRYPGGGGRDTFLTDLAARSNLRVVGSAAWRGANKQLSLGESPEDYKQRLARLSRPTVSSHFRFENPRLSFSYDNRTEGRDGRYVWERMDYGQDVHRCMWSRHGTIIDSYKLMGRPATRS